MEVPVFMYKICNIEQTPHILLDHRSAMVRMVVWGVPVLGGLDISE
jgi:hypothetical protein